MKKTLIFVILIVTIVLCWYLIISFLNNKRTHLIIDKNCKVDDGKSDYPSLACYNNTEIYWIFKEKGFWITQWENTDSGVQINVGNSINIEDLDQVRYDQDWLYIKDGLYSSMFINGKDVQVNKVIPYSKIHTKTKESKIYENEEQVPFEERIYFNIK